MWYIKNGVTRFLRSAAIIIHIKPAMPAVKYVKADKILSIGYKSLERCNCVFLSEF